MYHYKRIAFCFAFLCLVLNPYIVHAASIAKVIAITGGVSLERAGQSSELKLKDDLLLNDIIRTDANGKAQFIFNDNSTVTVGVNSSFVMEAYDDGDAKSFQSNVAVGLARFVTGSIVESNPEAFSVRTPEATVGIRGTTLAVLTSNGQTIVSTENSTKQQSVVVNDTVVPPGHMAIFGPNASIISAPTPMTQTQRQNIIDQTRIGTPVAATNLDINNYPDDVMHGLISQSEFESTLNATRLINTTTNSIETDITIADATNAANSLANSREVLGLAVGGFEFEGVGGNDTEGSFSFEANLTSGVISQATFNTTNAGGGTFTVSGGSGLITPNSFSISGGAASFTSQGAGNLLNSWNVRGTEQLAIGSEVEGDLTVDAQGTNQPYRGEIEGALFPK